jgi:hypothetical protein
VAHVVRVRDVGGRVRAAGTAALAAAACLAFATPASAFEVEESAAEIRDYWTPERMRNAIPMGPLGLGDGSQRGGGTIAKRVRDSARAPQRTHGKVFFTLDGVNYVCSGTSVRSPSKSLVWTAGHCMYGTGLLDPGYASRWVFVPAYRNGNTPYGRWPAHELHAARGWRQSNQSCLPGDLLACGNVAKDFGAALVHKRGGGGPKLQNAVGGRGIVFGAERNRTYRLFGYPQEAPFNGEHMYRCRSQYKGADQSQGNPPPMRARCDMTGGSSGGGWVTNGSVASVISYGYADEPNRLYGPYQGPAARNLFDSAKNG